jgi:hypothetical protein
MASARCPFRRAPQRSPARRSRVSPDDRPGRARSAIGGRSSGTLQLPEEAPMRVTVGSEQIKSAFVAVKDDPSFDESRGRVPAGVSRRSLTADRVDAAEV